MSYKEMLKATVEENQRLRAALEVCDFVLHRAEPTDAQLHAAQQASSAYWSMNWQTKDVYQDLPDWEWSE